MISEFSEALMSEVQRHAAWGAAQLDALTDWLPEGPWTADLPDCVYRQGGLELRIGVLGSYDGEARTWMWAWANPGLRGTGAAALSAAVARYGQARGIPELTQDVVELGGFEDPRRAAETLAFAGMGVAESPGYIGVPAGPTTQVYFLPDDVQVPRAGPEPVTLPRVLLEGAGLFARPHRAAVTGYFEHHGLSWSEQGEEITAELPGGSACTVGFDAQGRISGIRGKLSGDRSVTD